MQVSLEGLTPFHTDQTSQTSSATKLDSGARRDGVTPARLLRAGFWTSVLAFPAAAAAIAYATSPSRRSRASRSAIAAAATAFGLSLARWQLDGRFNEEPAHVTEKRVGKLEVRRYAPMVVAETTLVGSDWDEALSDGFRRLFDFISGHNTVRPHIELTAPLHSGTQDKAGEKIAMTAPVAAGERAGGHTITFVMPKGKSLEALPVPADSRIQLRELPERRVAVLRFTGSYREEPVRAKMRELLAMIEQAGWRAEGEPQFGGYDPPWTLPFLRRNEVWVELADSSALYV